MTNQPVSTSIRPATHPLAIVSLVLSILGLFPPVLPLIGSIAGIITGRIARREMLAHPEWYRGEGMAQAGVILGWVGIGLCALALVLGVLGFFFFAISSSTITTGPTIVITTVP